MSNRNRIPAGLEETLGACRDKDDVASAVVAEPSGAPRRATFKSGGRGTGLLMGCAIGDALWKTCARNVHVLWTSCRR
jgi:hypothetical protein